MSKLRAPKFLGWSAVALAAAIGIAGLAHGPAKADGVPVPAPAYNPPDPASSETATLSGGCFWGMSM